MATLAGWRGALLLEPVGTGKTWVALGVAACERGPVVAIVPAILRAQWAEAAARANVTLHLWTHERASRGTLPSVRASLVIVDEAHRLRDPATRRTQTIAPWLVGRRTLLLTATPIVNRLADLLTLLRLAVPEDALALDGIPRLGDIKELPAPSPALRRIAVRSPPGKARSITTQLTSLAPEPPECARGSAAVAAIRGLQLSESVPIRRLITSVLLDAAASSDAAFHQALKRYRALLLQARDSGGASRAMLRRFAGESLDQLVLWPVLTGDSAVGELPLGDIARIEQLRMIESADASWIAGLAAHCDDDRPTICFTRHRATATALRVALGEDVAWITGSEAGIGPHRLHRDQLLAAFGAKRADWRLRRNTPRILVATDVAAEGLDLHAAGRIAHVDLPWTAARVEQREGRLLRIGQMHTDVEVVIRLPAPAIEAALAPQARVRRKRRLADEWLRTLESGDESHTGTPAAPLICQRHAAGIATTDQFTMLLERDGRVGAVTIEQPSVSDIERGIAQAVRTAIGQCTGADGGSRALVSRIHQLARRAASRRDGPALQQLDRLLRFATASPTLGARMLIATLTDATDRELLDACVPDVPSLPAIKATVIGGMVTR